MTPMTLSSCDIIRRHRSLPPHFFFGQQGNLSDRFFVIFGHERRGFFAGEYRSRRELTAEALRAQSKEFLINNYSDLCELRVSAVK